MDGAGKAPGDVTYMTDLVYILAASHSGSTLLAMLLAAHPDLCSIGELKVTNLGDVQRYRCSCGQLIRRCEFWEGVREKMAGRGMTFDVADSGTDFRSAGGRYVRRLLAPMHRGVWWERVRDAALALSPSWHRQRNVIQERNAELAATVCELTGAKAIVDSSKVALRLKYLLRNSQLNVKVIRLIRDGRAVALTYMAPGEFADSRDPTLREGGTGGQGFHRRLTMAEGAYEWRRNNEAVEHVLAGMDGSQWLAVRYEDLCDDPASTLGRVFSFLGVDGDRWVRDFRSVAHHVVGNGMRLDTASEIRRDERWRQVLTDDDLAVFGRVAGALNQRYGYEDFCGA